MTLHPAVASEVSTAGANSRAFDFSANDIKTLSPLVLAHVGDAYFSLYVRTRLLQITHNITRLHDLSAQIVSAPAQANTYHAIENFLTDDERDIFRRGRNANVHTIPHSADRATYQTATALEALFGWLYLKGERARINELFSVMMEGYDVA